MPRFQEFWEEGLPDPKEEEAEEDAWDAENADPEPSDDVPDESSPPVDEIMEGGDA